MSENENVFNPKAMEQKWWQFWMEGNWFHADAESDKEPYTVLIPPPNVTDRLHMGHGLNNTIQDILVRWKRMQGFNCLWLPGTDHAGISTQMMVTKALEKEGINIKELGREKFFEKCVEWKDRNGGMIIEQLKRLGASCDWEREAYTMSAPLSKAVRRIFVDLFNDGLIYRGERLVNWDPVIQTAISDDEVETKDTKGHLWYIRYPLESGDGHIVIATTRPETMFADAAVAVHPDDERFKHLIGQNLILPLAKRPIPIIADTHVKMEFGTGCVKISPAHDFNDFEIGMRHKLPFLNVFDDKAHLNSVCPTEFAGLERFEARKRVVAALEKQDLIEKIDPYHNAVPISERSKAVLEPRLSKQWYVRMKSLAEPAIEYGRTGQVRFHPDAWKKTYFHWLENIQDWCISRQLWWGHQIPIWYCQDCDAVSTGIEDPTECSKCQSTNLKRDEDVLDTWFSSWLWPISPFGWPEETKDLQKFFPSNVLVTGPDIIFLWVARMLMVSHYTRQQPAFKDVYFNSVICDKQGRKFSKTLGNGIDPLATIDKYGADATRFTCISLAPLGGRVRMEVEDFATGFRFVNKIWNASRFLKQKWGAKTSLPEFDAQKLNLPNQWLVNELHLVTKKVNDGLDKYLINDACRDLYHFIWQTFCDWSLETAKIDFDNQDADQTLATLLYVFEGLLRLASPFMPFVTEEIWQELPHSKHWDRPKSLVIAKFPKAEQIPAFAEAAQQWEQVRAIISGIRSIRTQAGISPKEKLDVYIQCGADMVPLLNSCEPWIARLAQARALHVSVSMVAPKQSLTAAGKEWSLAVPVGDLMDVEKEKLRLSKEVARIQKIIDGIEKKLQDPTFTGRAPAEVVATTKEQLHNMRSQQVVLQENLKSLES